MGRSVRRKEMEYSDRSLASRAHYIIIYLHTYIHQANYLQYAYYTYYYCIERAAVDRGDGSGRRGACARALFEFDH